MLDSIPLKLVVAALAAWQLVETLRHGSLFRELRRWGNRNLERRGLLGLWAKFVGCAFCQSHWAPLGPWAVLCWGPTWMQFLVVCLALTRLSQLASDASHGFNRSPSPDEEWEEDEIATVDSAE